MRSRDELDPLAVLESLREPQIVCWRDLDPESTQAELDRLTEWVVERYRLDHKVIPPCWREHGCLIEELSALHILWQGCYQDDASPSDPVTFHRDLDMGLRRMREWRSRLGCSRTVHRQEVAD